MQSRVWNLKSPGVFPWSLQLLKWKGYLQRKIWKTQLPGNNSQRIGYRSTKIPTITKIITQICIPWDIPLLGFRKQCTMAHSTDPRVLPAVKESQLNLLKTKHIISSQSNNILKEKEKRHGRVPSYPSNQLQEAAENIACDWIRNKMQCPKM